MTTSTDPERQASVWLAVVGAVGTLLPVLVGLVEAAGR